VVRRDIGFHERNLGSIKMKMPITFQERSYLEAYLEWKKKMGLIFYCHNYSKEKKVRLVMIEFIDYSIIWWE
jgi:hypothetical protein